MVARLPTVIRAYLAACVAGGFAATLLMVSPAIVLGLLQGRSFSTRVHPVAALVSGAAVVSLLAAIFALLPTAVLIALAEARRQRSAAFYGIAGTVAAILAWGTMHACGLIMVAWSPTTAPHRPALLDTARRLLTGEQVIFLLIACVGGLVGGLVYWRIAGRTAGLWRVEQEATP